MTSVQYLRELMNERLSAAAEEIFRDFQKTIVQYVEEIDRQRRMLDIVWKPEIKLHRIGMYKYNYMVFKKNKKNKREQNGRNSRNVNWELELNIELSE